MKLLFPLLFLLLPVSFIFSQDHSGEGEQYKYVWNRNGIVLYSSFDGGRERLATLPFGEKVRTVSLTTKPINQTTEFDLGESTSPYVLSGRWIKVSTSKGTIGYVSDVFLLEYQPYVDKKRLQDGCLLKAIDVDTVFQRKVPSGGDGLNLKVVTLYEFDIEEIGYSAGVWGSSEFYIPNCSIQEAFVFLTANADGLFYNMQLSKNTPNKLYFTDNGMCDVSFKREGSDVRIEIFCTC